MTQGTPWDSPWPWAVCAISASISSGLTSSTRSWEAWPWPPSVLLVILFPGGVVIRPGEEHDEDHPEGVIGRQEGAEKAQAHPELVVQGPELAQDGLLAEEAGEREDPGQGQGADGHRDHGDESLRPPSLLMTKKSLVPK